MITSGERKALLFLAGIISLGSAVRVVKWRAGEHDPASGVALAAQLARVDSARRSKSGVQPKGRSGSRAAATRARKPVAAPLSEAIDMDRADAAEIQRLPGVGPVLAERIVSNRDSLGPFGSLEGLRRVKGIGPKVAERLDGHVTFTGVARPSNAVLLPASAPPERRGGRRVAPIP